MYSKSTNLVLGFHGCDKSIVEAVIHGEEMIPSKKDYDWLGHGVYFWENDPRRAYEWAIESSKRKTSSVNNPAVLGAVIDLGRCLDLSCRDNIEMLRAAYEKAKNFYDGKGLPLPQNENIKGNDDWIKRYLDCVIIETIHSSAEETSDVSSFPRFDSVKCMFTEGNSIYPGSGFKEKTHTQICIINPNCIKGCFIPREINPQFPLP